MIRSLRRTARKFRHCDRCHSGIRSGQVYVTHVISPEHDDLGNPGWWRLSECSPCARTYGRGHLVATGDCEDDCMEQCQGACGVGWMGARDEALR